MKKIICLLVLALSFQSMADLSSVSYWKNFGHQEETIYDERPSHTVQRHFICHKCGKSYSRTFRDTDSNAYIGHSHEMCDSCLWTADANKFSTEE